MNKIYSRVNLAEVKEVKFSTSVIRTRSNEYAYSIWEIRIIDFHTNYYDYYAFSSDKSFEEFKEEVIKEIEQDFDRQVAFQVSSILGDQK